MTELFASIPGSSGTLRFVPGAMAMAIVIIAALAWLAWPLLRTRVRAKTLMTRIEREVLRHIEAAAPGCRVHAEVCLGALLQPARWLPQGASRRARYGYASKIVDFVFEDRSSGEVLGLVEIDDRSHDRRADRARDRLTARAGYRTIRLPGHEYLTKANLAARIARGLENRRQVGTGGSTGLVNHRPARRSARGNGPAKGNRHEQLGF